MKRPVDEIKQLINSNPTEFFLQFSEGLKGMEATDLAKTLEYLKLNDQYVKSIIGSASEDTARFRKSIDLSNESLKEATSLQIEFNKVNNNSAAIYDKVRKKFIGMLTSESLAKFLNFFIESFGKIIGAIEDTSGGFRVFGQTLLFVIKLFTIGAVSVISYNTAIALSNLTMASLRTTLLGYTVVQKVNNFLNQSGAVLQNFFTATLLRTQIAYYGLRGATELQAAAQAKLNLITKANPYVAVIALVATLTAAYFAFRTEIDETAKKKAVLNDITKEAAQSAATEISQLDQLYKRATDVKRSIEERTAAAQKLLEIYPDQFKNQSAEIIMNGKAEASYLNLRDSIIAVARAKAAQKQLEKRAEERLIRDEELDKKLKAEAKTLVTIKADPGKFDKQVSYDTGDNKNIREIYTGETQLNDSRSRFSNLLEAKKNNEKADKIEDAFVLDIISAAEKRDTKLNNSAVANPAVDFGGADSKGSKKAKGKNKGTAGKTDAQRAAEKEQQDMIKAGEAAKDLAIKLEVDKQEALAEVQTEWYEKERLQILAQEKAKITELEKLKISGTDMVALDALIGREKDEKLKTAFEETKKLWLKNNADLDNLILSAKESTQLKLKTLDEKQIAEQIKLDEQEFNRKSMLIQQESNLKISELTTLAEQRAFLEDKLTDKEFAKIQTREEGKQAIEKYFQGENLKMQEEYLKALVEQLDALPTANLTPEQLEVLEAMRFKLSEIAKAKSELQGEDVGQQGKSLSQFGGSKDILGLTPDQWEGMFASADTFEQKVQKIGAAIEVTRQLFSKYFEFVAANDAKQLRQFEVSSDRKKNKLKQELNNGYINQEEYKRQNIRLDMELDQKKAELEYKAAKRQRAIMIADAIASTAIAVVGALGNKPWTPLNFALAGIVGAMGALQLATIASQPLPSAPGAEDGYYPTIREQDGKRFNARRQTSKSGIYSEPTMLVGEQGKNFPELVVSGSTMKRIDPKIQRVYMNEVARVEGFEKGLYPAQSSGGGNDEILMMAVQALNRNSAIMEKIEDRGIQAKIEKSARNGKDISEMTKDYENLYNKNKY